MFVDLLEGWGHLLECAIAYSLHISVLLSAFIVGTASSQKVPVLYKRQTIPFH